MLISKTPNPFIREIWGGELGIAHNGNLKNLPDMSNYFLQPIGSTDSEAAFLLFSRISQKYLPPKT